MTNSENKGFASYGKTFQEKLCYLVLKDRIFCDRMVEVLNPDFFEFRYLQWFVEKIFEYKKKYKAQPSFETMETVIFSFLSAENELLQKQVRDYFVRIRLLKDVDNAEFVISESLDFCRKQNLHEAMLQSARLLKTNSFDQISTLINNALRAGGEIEPGLCGFAPQ